MSYITYFTKAADIYATEGVRGLLRYLSDLPGYGYAGCILCDLGLATPDVDDD